jgi:hypothetical protein
MGLRCASSTTEVEVVGRADEGQRHSFLNSALFIRQPLYPWAKKPGTQCTAGWVGATAGLTTIHTTGIRTPDRQSRSIVSIQSAPLQTTENCSRWWSALTGKYQNSTHIQLRSTPSESFPIQHQSNYYRRCAVSDTDTLMWTAQYTRPY